MPNTERILVVEDNADDGQQALDLLERGIRPRLVILDLVLPKVTGSDLLRHMQSDPELRTTRVIVITAMNPEDVQAVGDVILNKPIEIPILPAAVADLMPPSARAKARR